MSTKIICIFIYVIVIIVVVIIVIIRGRPEKGNTITLAEFGSMQMELVRLSQLTGNEEYGLAGNYILEKMSKVPSRVPGLYPMIWDLDSFTPRSSKSFFFFII